MVSAGERTLACPIEEKLMAQLVANAVERELDQVRSNDEAGFEDWFVALGRSVQILAAEIDALRAHVGVAQKES